GEGGVATRALKSGGEPDPEDRARDRAKLVSGSSSKSIQEPQDLRRLAASTAAGPDPRGSETQLPSESSLFMDTQLGTETVLDEKPRISAVKPTPKAPPIMPQ
ncbi:hypothetical protein AMELA_G00244930, partial [Ameiurus melas]